MKKLYYLIMLCLIAGTASLSAQDVAVTNLQVTDNNIVTFDVSWGNDGRLWGDTVWVFVDYFDMNSQQMWRRPVSSATLTNSSPAGAGVRMIDGNNAGFYIEGNANGTSAFTASVSVTPVGTYPQGVLRPCVYVIDYPPVINYSLSGGSVIANLAGTAPYAVKYSDGASTIVTSGSNFTLPAGKSVTTFFDASGSEGKVFCGTAGSEVKLTSGADTQNQTLCADTPLTATSYTLGGSAGSYSIKNLPAGLTHTFDPTTKVLTVSGTPTESKVYIITTTGHTAPCVADAISGTVTVNANPVIKTQPITQFICLGTAAALSVGAEAGSGTITTYQWKADGGTVGGNASTYTSAVFEDSATITYTVTVTNSNNCAVTSNNAVVTVEPCLDTNEICYDFKAGIVGKSECAAFDAGRIGK